MHGATIKKLEIFVVVDDDDDDINNNPFVGVQKTISLHCKRLCNADWTCTQFIVHKNKI
jgi:hypothetical protein